MSDQRFYRSSDRILGGVCAGLAEGFHVDALWIRVAFLVLIFVQGIGLFLYVVLWLVMPERLEGGAERSGFDAMTVDLRRIWWEVQHPTAARPQPAAPAPQAGAQPTGTFQNQSLVLGLVLVAIGLVVLGTNIGIINWSVVWPAALITLGIVILVRNLEKRP